MSSLPGVSIVVVGHNESQHLESCFNAINELEYPKEKIQVVFVDSNSSDKSIEIARKYSHKIVSIQSHWPTAGEAFNAGIRVSDYDYVHITAGDIQLNREYLRIAMQALVDRPDLSCVTGFFRESNHRGWNKVLSYRRLDGHELAEGYSLTPNGGTFRKTALLEVNGYDERVKKGQETELGLRFKEHGFKIWYLNICQGVHDFDISSFFDLVKRYVNDGKSSGHLFLLYLNDISQRTLNPFFKNVRRKLIMMFFYALTILLFIITGNCIFFTIPFLLYFAVLPLKIILKHRKKNSKYNLYLITNSLMGAANYYGIISFFIYYFLLKMKGINLLGPRLGLKISNSKVRNVSLIT